MKRWGKIVLAGAIVANLGILVLTIGFFAYFYKFMAARAPGQVKVLIEEIRERGEPVTPEEFEAWYPDLPPEANGAPAYERAFEALRILETEEETPLERLRRDRYVVGDPSRAPLPPEDAACIETLLADNAEALALLHEAARNPQCRYVTDYSEGIGSDVLVPLDSLRSASRLLMQQAVWAADRGNTQAAFAALLDQAALSRSLTLEPTFTPQMLRGAILDNALWGMAYLLQRRALTPAQSAALSEALEQCASPECLYRGFLYERTEQLQVFAKIEGRPVWEWSPRSSKGLRDSLWAWRCASLLRAELTIARECVKAARLPFPQALRAVGAIRVEHDAGWRSLLRGYGSGVYMANYQLLFDRAAANPAQLRCIGTTLAIERYRNEHGTLPDTLDALVPPFLDAVPIDPFDGAPLRYERLPAGYKVYTIWYNGVDDGGEPPGEGEDRRGLCRRDSAIEGPCGGLRLRRSPVTLAQNDSAPTFPAFESIVAGIAIGTQRNGRRKKARQRAS